MQSKSADATMMCSSIVGAPTQLANDVPRRRARPCCAGQFGGQVGVRVGIGVAVEGGGGTGVAVLGRIVAVGIAGGSVLVEVGLAARVGVDVGGAETESAYQ